MKDGRNARNWADLGSDGGVYTREEEETNFQGLVQSE